MPSSRRFPLALCTALLLPSAAVRAQDDAAAYFERRVRPILVQRCYSCHSETAGKKKGGLIVDRGDRFRKGGSSGPAVLPGRPDESLLIEAIRYGDPSLRMPPSGKLAQHEIDDLTTWVR